jgi:hypothetical protein
LLPRTIEKLIPVDVPAIVTRAIDCLPKLVAPLIPRIELLWANYINNTLPSNLVDYLEKTAHIMTMNASWPGRDFKQLSNILPMLLKKTDGVDLDTFELDDFQKYYPAYWKIWNYSIADIDNIEGFTGQDFVDYLEQYEEHFGYQETDAFKNGMRAYADLDEKGNSRLSKETMLNPDTRFYEGIKSRYLFKINAFMWHNISSKSRDLEYLSRFKLTNV